METASLIREAVIPDRMRGEVLETHYNSLRITHAKSAVTPELLREIGKDTYFTYLFRALANAIQNTNDPDVNEQVEKQLFESFTQAIYDTYPHFFYDTIEQLSPSTMGRELFLRSVGVLFINGRVQEARLLVFSMVGALEGFQDRYLDTRRGKWKSGIGGDEFDGLTQLVYDASIERAYTLRKGQLIGDFERAQSRIKQAHLYDDIAYNCLIYNRQPITSLINNTRKMIAAS